LAPSGERTAASFQQEVIVADLSPFIKTVRLRNILSFGSEGAEIDLQPLNILIGPNTSGKSNFVEILALLRSLPRDFKAQIREGGGALAWLWKGAAEDVEGHVEILVDSLRVTYMRTSSFRYKLSFQELFNEALITGEVLEDSKGSEMPKDQSFYYKYADGQAVIVPDAQAPKILAIPGEATSWDSTWSRQEPILAQIKDPTTYSDLTYFGFFLRTIYLMRVGGLGRFTGARQPQRADLPTYFLLEDGSNLGLILNDLQNRPPVWKQITDRLKDVYPDLESIHTRVYSGHVEVLVHQKGLRAPISAQRLSDGTLRYLCLLCILCHPKPPPVICIEEPELGLHPDMIHKVAELLREASERTQLIVTTHSDILVSAFNDHPEAIVVCERDEDGTHFRRLESGRLKEWLKEYSLGDLWLSGEIGGTRW